MNFVSPSGHSHNVHDSDEADKHPGHSVLKKRGYKYQGTGEGFGGNLEHHYTHGSNPKEHVVLQKVKHANGEVEHVWRQYGSKGGYREGRNAEGLHHAAVKEEHMANQENGAFQITSAIETLLKKKTGQAIEETRKQVAADAFGIQFDDPTTKIQEEIEAAYESTDQLNERSEVDHPLAKELASQAVHNHEQFHQGNHDARHGGWAMHDLHTWAKNYAKKADKGVYDKEKAVKGLTHAIRNSEASTFGQAHGTKHGQRISGATRTQAARHLLPHVEKLMDQHRKKKTVAEAQSKPVVNRAMLQEAMSKQHYVGLADHIKASGVPFSHEHLKVLSGFMKKDNPKFDADRWHGYVAGKNGPSGGKLKEAEKMTPEQIKAQKKADWKNDVRMPWPKDYGKISKSKSPIRDFAEQEEMNEELLPGHTLNAKQKGHVLSAFVDRHTGEHKPEWAKKTMPNGQKYQPTHKTDDDWVNDHAFHFSKKTGNLSGKHKYAEPNYMAKK